MRFITRGVKGSPQLYRVKRKGELEVIFQTCRIPIKAAERVTGPSCKICNASDPATWVRSNDPHAFEFACGVHFEMPKAPRQPLSSTIEADVMQKIVQHDVTLPGFHVQQRLLNIQPRLCCSAPWCRHQMFEGNKCWLYIHLTVPKQTPPTTSQKSAPPNGAATFIRGSEHEEYHDEGGATGTSQANKEGTLKCLWSLCEQT